MCVCCVSLLLNRDVRLLFVESPSPITSANTVLRAQSKFYGQATPVRVCFVVSMHARAGCVNSISSEGVVDVPAV